MRCRWNSSHTGRVPVFRAYSLEEDQLLAVRSRIPLPSIMGFPDQLETVISWSSYRSMINAPILDRFLPRLIAIAVCSTYDICDCTVESCAMAKQGNELEHYPML